MAVEATFTKQMCVLTTEDRGAWIREMAKLWGVSQAQVARDCVELGAGRLEALYTRQGRSRKTDRPAKASAPKRARTPRKRTVAPAASAA